MTDIVMDTVQYDLLIEDKDIKLFSDLANLTVQKVKINLLNYRGNWFLDIDDGVPYIQSIFGIKDSKDFADIEIKKAISETDNVSEITSYQSTISSKDRKLIVIFSANLSSGEKIKNIELEI